MRKGGGKSLSHAEGGGGGHNKFWGSFYAVAQSHINEGGAKRFHSSKGGGGQQVLPCLEGGGAQKVSDPRLSHFVAPPPPPLCN